MNDMLLLCALALMFAAAVLTVVTDRLLTAVMYAGALSALAALGYLLLGAPDVALAEVVVGATLATVIYLVTLKKYHIFTVYLTSHQTELTRRVCAVLERTLSAREIEPHLLNAQEDARDLLARPGCDLVLEARGERAVLHGEASSRYVEEIMQALAREALPATLEDSLSQTAADYKEGRL